MAHPRGKRSQKSTAKRFILDTSFHDREKAETICIVTPLQIVEQLQREYPYVHMEAVQFQRGEVIINSRGEGSFQQ